VGSFFQAQKAPKPVFGRGSATDPLRELTTLLQHSPIISWVGGHPSIPIHLPFGVSYGTSPAAYTQLPTSIFRSRTGPICAAVLMLSAIHPYRVQYVTIAWWRIGVMVRASASFVMQSMGFAVRWVVFTHTRACLHNRAV